MHLYIFSFNPVLLLRSFFFIKKQLTRRNIASIQLH